MKISMHAMSVDVLSNILGNLSWLLVSAHPPGAGRL
jgi:hypothetical protein